MLERDLASIDEALGRDADAWRRLLGPSVREWERLVPAILAPVVRPPRHPILMARFGLPALLPATSLVRLAFREPAARALFTGMAAHSMLRLSLPLSGSFGLMLGLLVHAVGWPVARGGSGAISAALEAEARSLGVEIETGHRVDTLADLPPAGAVLLDVTPRQVLEVAGDRLPPATTDSSRASLRTRRVQDRLGVDGPIPWRTGRGAGRHRAPGRPSGGNRSLGRRQWLEDGTRIGRSSSSPSPPSSIQRATPEGKHVAWAYCHVPNGSTVDMTERSNSR